LTSINDNLYSGHKNGNIIQWNSKTLLPEKVIYGNGMDHPITRLISINNKLYAINNNKYIKYINFDNNKLYELSFDKTVISIGIVNGILYSGHYNSIVLKWNSHDSFECIKIQSIYAISNIIDFNGHLYVSYYNYIAKIGEFYLNDYINKKEIWKAAKVLYRLAIPKDIRLLIYRQILE
jgi:hypothetical protein